MRDPNNYMMEVRMPDGSLWGVPVPVISAHRGRFFAHMFGGDKVRSLVEDTLPLFSDNEAAIRAWAEFHMQWADVAPHAVKLSPATEMVYQEGWVNGEKSFRPLKP